jgi:PAS domain S-box-containing protein
MTQTRILIVEDELIVARSTQRYLEGLGCIVLPIAASGREAIQIAAETQPDLVLMDIKLPGELDGVDTAEILLAHYDIPIIYLTASADGETLARAKVTEPFGYLVKPFSKRDLQITIEMGLYKHQMECKLKAQERWLAATLRSIGDAIITTDTHRSITFMNPIAERLTGWQQAEALGRDLDQVFKIISKNTRQSVACPALQALAEGRVIELADDIYLIARDGREIPIDNTSAPIIDDYGKVTGAVSVFHDITERRQAEEALRISKERYALAQRAASIGSWDRDIKTGFLYWSEEVEAMFGFGRGEFDNRFETFLNCVHPEDRQLLLGAINISWTENKEYELEHRIVRPDGTVRWVLERGNAVRDEQANPIHFTGVVQDITERKLAQAALAESEGRYRLLSELISDYAYAHYQFPDGHYEPVWVTEAFNQIYGLSQAEFEARGGLLAFVHPDDLQTLITAKENLLVKGEAYDLEFRVINIHGETRWLHDSGRPVNWRGPDQAVLVYGAGSDITEGKRVEEALQQRNRELALLNKVSQSFISTLDLDQVLTTVLEEVRSLLNVVACSAWLIDPETQELVCRQVTDPQGQIVRGWRLAPGQGIAGWVAQQGQSLLVADTYLDPRHYKQVDQRTGLEIRSILSVPLRVNQAIIGVLQAVDGKVNRFTETDLALLEPLATTAAMAIENARLYEQTRQDADTKAMLLREVNHRVKNNLAAIIGLLYAEQHHAQVKDQDTYQMIMQDIISRIHGLATAHHLLSEAEWSPLPLASLIEQVIDSALRALRSDKYIFVDIQPSPVCVTPKQANDLALVINELATNTLKYALSEQQTAHITVGIAQEDDRVQLEFRDDGPGYPEDVLSARRYNVGLYLIQTITSKGLAGQVTLRNEHGAITTLRFPLSEEKLEQ